jgi:hypothetical protein
MKKQIMTWLFFVVFGLLPLPAETWEQLIERAETIVYDTQEGLTKGNYNTWSIDKWGALLASLDFLRQIYEQIYRNAPNLSTHERAIYKNIYQQRATASSDIGRLFDIMHPSGNDRLRIMEREKYWFKHLRDGGTITFN